ncbi:MAG: TIGR01777 family oxidoreductase [Terrimicrobiaceae bacterium]
MKIGITGVTGFIGERLKQMAESGGHQVTGFSRQPTQGSRAFSLDRPCDVSGLDVVIHLAGESILGLWTESKKRRIRESRILGTRSVVDGFESSKNPPRVLVSASAVGIYGDTGEVEVKESSPCGRGFLASVAREWEAEAVRAEALGVRVILLRIGFVLGPGGAMKLIGPIFRAGLGGNLGNGRQWMSAVHVDDVAGMALWAAGKTSLRGPVNAVMPSPFRNSEFTKALGAAFHRPTILPAPAFAIRMALGELSHVMLDSCRVKPSVALREGYRYHHESLPDAV